VRKWEIPVCSLSRLAGYPVHKLCNVFGRDVRDQSVYKHDKQRLHTMPSWNIFLYSRGSKQLHVLTLQCWDLFDSCGGFKQHYLHFVLPRDLLKSNRQHHVPSLSARDLFVHERGLKQYILPSVPNRHMVISREPRVHQLPIWGMAVT